MVIFYDISCDLTKKDRGFHQTLCFKPQTLCFDVEPLQTGVILHHVAAAVYVL